MPLPPLLAAALLAGFLCGCAGPTAAAAGPESEKGAAQATDFSLRALDGNTFRLSNHLGKDVILMNFWATWCVPCLGEMPELEKIYQQYKDQGLTIVGVAMDGPETIANVESTIRRYGISYPVVLDEETRVTNIYNPTRDAPYAVLIDRSGKIVDRKLGYSPGDEVKLKEEIRELLSVSVSGGR